MIKVFLFTAGKIIIILVVVCQLLITSCSIKVYTDPPLPKKRIPEPSVVNLENHKEKKKLIIS